MGHNIKINGTSEPVGWHRIIVGLAAMHMMGSAISTVYEADKNDSLTPNLARRSIFCIIAGILFIL